MTSECLGEHRVSPTVALRYLSSADAKLVRLVDTPPFDGISQRCQRLFVAWHVNRCAERPRQEPRLTGSGH